MADPTSPLSLVERLLERFLASGRTLDLRDVPAIAQGGRADPPGGAAA
ncbi:hypothetical protein AB0A71_32165 [Kitasatospora aureofaciens]